MYVCAVASTVDDVAVSQSHENTKLSKKYSCLFLSQFRKKVIDM
jgi:hypothetical protein